MPHRRTLLAAASLTAVLWSRSAAGRPPPACLPHALQIATVLSDNAPGLRSLAGWGRTAARLAPCQTGRDTTALQLTVSSPPNLSPSSTSYRARLTLPVSVKTGRLERAGRESIKRLARSLPRLIRKAERNPRVVAWRKAFQAPTAWWEDQDGAGAPCLAYRAGARAVDKAGRPLGGHELRFCQGAGLVDYSVQGERLHSPELDGLRALLTRCGGPLVFARLTRYGQRRWSASGLQDLDTRRVRFLGRQGVGGWALTGRAPKSRRGARGGAAIPPCTAKPAPH